MDLLKKQLEENNIEINFEDVVEIDYKDELFFIKTDKKTVKSRIVVILQALIQKNSLI